ncbi:MAG TPA: VCBS repeat-containing protein [Phycisphaerae bacterium]|nr:VCBS repeat-containing protein [Phycisphaerae bacterium]
MVGSCEGEPRDCSHLDVSCLSGWCDPLDGQCVAPEYDDCNSNFFPDICEHYTLFSPQKIITADADGATSAIAADLDNDGDLDVLAACQFADELTWYENTDGKGTFGLPRGISTEVDRPNSVFAADLDGDGDLDVLSASLYDDKICWYENMDGIGEFGAQQIISTSADSPYSVFSIDIDGDGDFDVLSASSSDDKIAWYENTDGNGQFGPQQVITSSARGARSVFSTDIDGDGDADVLSAARNDWRIAWYANTNGLGGFGPQQTISGNTYRASAVFGTDLDGDGDTDVISAADFDGEIAWHENLDGHGDFGPQKIIYSAADFAVSLFAADLDKDGDTDVLSASRDDDKIAWYENRINEPHSDADGFSNPTFLSTTANGASSVFAADLNGDGNLDVLSASYADDKIAWYENSRPKDCNNNDILDVCDIASGTSTDCDASAVPDECELGGNDCNLNAVLDACDIAGPTSTDCDNNDLPDECQLVGNDCNSNGVFDTCDIVGFESLDCNADGIPDECQLANNDCNSNNAPDECDLAGATSNDCNDNSLPDECELANNDCNHNGTPDECDVIATFNDESGPLGPFGIGTSLVYTAMAPPRALGDVTLEFTANLNFGIFDPFIHVQINNQFIGNVLRNTSACSVTSDQLVLTPVEFNELVGGDNVAIKMVPIGNIFSSGCGDDFISVRLSYVGANDCNMNDVPDDCDVTNNDCNLNGIPDDCDTDTLFSPQQVISTSADHAVSVFVEDLNGDGNLDVLSASYADRKIAWYENMNSSGAFGPEQIITTNASYARAVSSADLDGDGDADVLVAAEFDNMIAWHDNIDGLGSFGPQRVITANAASAQFAFAADLDGDGDNDVLSASADDDKIAWYENVDGLGTFGIQQIITTAAGGARSVFAEDLDGDGDLDVLSASASENEVAWYENTDGLGSFGVPQEIYPAYHATSVIARDLDGDGDADVLWAAAYSDQIAWSENTDGLGSFGPRKNISLNADFAQTVFAADMDGDGDIDVLSASQFDGKIAWYENTDGLGEFGPEQIINAVAGGAQSVFAADLDNDGDVDVLSASTYEDKIAWYENTGNDCNGNLIPDACESDTDGDGLIDVCDPCIFGAGSGDSNGNGMLELDDFTDFELCLIGPDRGLFTGCECFDFDSDGDNDLIDFGAFQSIYTDN